MTVPRHIPEDDLALFALALMPPEEAAFTAEHLKTCDLCRAELARMQGDLAVYALTAAPASPPDAARTRLLTALATEKQLVAPPPATVAATAGTHRPITEDRQRAPMPPPRQRHVLGWMGWALAAGLAGLSLWQFQGERALREQMETESAALSRAHADLGNTADTERARQVLSTLTDPAAMQVALHLPATSAGEAKPEGHAAYVPGKGSLVFVGTHLRPIQPGKTYELWLLPATGTPIPAGLFRPDARGNASVVLPTLPRNVAAKGFGVTIENEGGSLTPTPPIVLAGTQG